MSPRKGASAPLNESVANNARGRNSSFEVAQEGLIATVFWSQESQRYSVTIVEERDRSSWGILRCYLEGALQVGRICRRLEELGIPDGFLGRCPHCGGNDGCLNVGREHWIVCHEHRTKWLRGENLFSSWKGESSDEWRANARILESYEELEPAFDYGGEL